MKGYKNIVEKSWHTSLKLQSMSKRCTILGTPKKSNVEESNWDLLDLLFIIWIAIGPLELIKMRINYFIKLGSFVICYPNWATKPHSHSTVNDWVLDWVNQIESSSTGTNLQETYKLAIWLASSYKLTIQLGSPYKLTIFCKKLASSYKFIPFSLNPGVENTRIFKI